ncbi:MAG TPA: ATP-binding protein [Flavitalea sp.]|nr:ATP-binding protein [Flavitalea sp.]
MKVRTKFLLFVFILHAITLVLSYVIFKKNQVLFIVSEFLILISIGISWQLYNELIRPLKTLLTGVEAIKDKDFNVKLIETGKYEVDQLINVYNQMMDHLRNERTRQEQQHFFLEKLIQTSPTGIIILDYDENIQQLNPKARELAGIDEKQVIGKSIADVALPLIEEVRKLKFGEPKTISLHGIRTFKLQKSHFVDRGFPRSFIMIEDVTEEILAAEKNAYGKVIRMMAHEVNNTIGPVNSILQSTLQTGDLWEHKKNTSLQHALQVALERNQNLNIFMRNFADVVRLPVPSKASTDLHKLINSVTVLMKLRAGERDIEFTYDLSPQPIFIDADPQQLEQVLINIIKNAMDAIGEKGSIRFTTTHHPKKLMITDTGRGISEEYAEHLFSPFFSTKKDGQGIGLTLVKEILLNHQYRFSLKTAAPGQTVFEIYFEP